MARTGTCTTLARGLLIPRAQNPRSHCCSLALLTGKHITREACKVVDVLISCSHVNYGDALPVFYIVGSDITIGANIPCAGGEVTLSPSASVLTIDYGNEAAGVPFFEVAVLSARTQIELKCAEDFAALSNANSDASWTFSNDSRIPLGSRLSTCQNRAAYSPSWCKVVSDGRRSSYRQPSHMMVMSGRNVVAKRTWCGVCAFLAGSSDGCLHWLYFDLTSSFDFTSSSHNNHS